MGGSRHWLTNAIWAVRLPPVGPTHLFAVFIDHRCMGAKSTPCASFESDSSSELALFQCNNGVCDINAIES